MDIKDITLHLYDKTEKIKELNSLINKFNKDYGMDNGYETNWECSKWGMKIHSLPSMSDDLTIREFKNFNHLEEQKFMKSISEIETDFSDNISVNIVSEHIEDGCYRQYLTIDVKINCHWSN
jgi:hypothetical protein